MVDIPAWAWGATIALILALFVFDLLVAVRRPHAVHIREATFWSVFYIGVALLFGLAVWVLGGSKAGTEYFSGWIVEKSLSVDNLFVFVIIMARFAVPAEFQQKALLFGIAAALVLRAALIAVGAAAINLFSFTFLIFGLILIWTAVQLIRHRNEQPDVEDTFLVRGARKILPVSQDFHGGRMLAHEDGHRVMTPLVLVFVAIGSTDVLFALDSIPAVFGVTKDPFLVFTANAFALLGLRALYFLIEGLLERLVFLSIGLSVILAFIGVKLILQFLHEDVTKSVPEIPTPLSLGVILVILLFTTAASLVRVHRHPEEKAQAGSIRKRREKRPEEEPAAR
ncbi:TerC/Alx family metal homeostasis membrane protein [Actinomadura darangshiensis]|uniref:TerC/Alx family metal homeostasis membrane protein n=1 Tax=Actinomadura darangshiensis TaxID=705336 RepID=A0A4R5AFJ9_9ACTN|nr:TerC/Alx family metal homeostasis membrane protein [Actinomadura darangshiensis]TDD71151.1 TerC/Alx family metal homeostasis membrane protein [Actinomadura darangshiensis]